MNFLRQHIESIKFMLLTLVGFTIALPFAVYINGLFILSLCGVWLLEGDLRNKYKSIKDNKLALVFISVMILFLIGGIYSPDKPEYYFELEKKYTLLAFPLVISTINITKKQLNTILKAFIFSCVLVVLLGVFFAIRRYLNDSSVTWYFFGQNLVMPLNLHRVYTSVHLMFALFATVYLNKNSLPLYLKYILITFFSIAILILASRIVIISFLLLGIIYWINITLSKKNKIQWLGAGIILLIFVMGFILAVPSTRNFMAYLVVNKNLNEVKQVDPNDGIHTRYLIWKNSLQVIQENWLIGKGTGGSSMALIDKYKEAGFDLGVESRFNPHNQYLHVFAELGIIGVLVFLLSLILPLYYSLKEKKYLYFYFIILISLAFLTESLLGSQKGIVFYAFFNALLAFAPVSIEKKNYQVQTSDLKIFN